MKQWPRDWAPFPNISLHTTSMYDECPRKWLYYTKPTVVKHEVPLGLRKEARLMAWNMLAGQVLDDTIRQALRHYEQKNKWPSDLTTIAEATLKSYSAAAVKERRLRSTMRDFPFGGPSIVDRIYFDDPITKYEVAEVRSKIRQCIEAFSGSDIQAFICHYPTNTWRIVPPIDDDNKIPWFYAAEVPVYANYDFAIHTDEATLIFDWKCGKRSPQAEERVRRQLHSYAAFALQKWSANPQQISLVVFWLAERDEWDTIPLDLELLERLSNEWSDRHRELVKRSRLAGDEYGAWEREFPLTVNGWACKRCTIRSCEGFVRSTQATIDAAADTMDDG